MNVFIKFLLSFLTPIYAHTTVETFYTNPITLQWQNYGEGYQYMVEVYDFNESEEILIYSSEWMGENIVEIVISNPGLYTWEVYIKELGKNCDEKYQCFCIESEYFEYSPQNESTEPPEEPLKEPPQPSNEASIEIPIVEQEEIVEKEVEKEVEKVKEKNVLGTSIQQYVPKQQPEVQEKEDKEENVKDSSKPEEKKKESNYCRYIYNIKKKEFRLEKCNIDEPGITSSTYDNYQEKYYINAKGKYQDRIKIYINNVVCKNFNLFDPKTWFKCNEISIGQTEYEIQLNHEVYFFNKQSISPDYYFFRNSDFDIYLLSQKMPTHLLFKGYFSLNHRGSWLDQELSFKKEVVFKKDKDLIRDSTAVYSFPFSKIIYVNQWHGCTQYQCPHTGIDFASIRENIYASDDGVVVAKGYDTYGGECNSGGYYLVIKYNNGHHMAYMHLEKMYVKNGQKVKRGDLIALSGNTGVHNCQPLGYHLHFELREERKQATHIDPVPYINVNWNLVRTNKADLFPKRLSGDNPHPKF
jgi:murein DD-endopeptidase MepM/ murein hydrolase activator NlpD